MMSHAAPKTNAKWSIPKTVNCFIKDQFFQASLEANEG